MDVGLFNMGIVVAQINKGNIENILDCKQINIKELIQYCDHNCNLEHNNCIADYMSHLFRDYKYFENADVILIERQPPQGFISIQEITNFKYRKKVVMISPNQMHNYFRISGLTYERRKEFTVEYARRWLTGFQDFTNERNHDIADAFCILSYYLTMLQNNEIKRKSTIKNFQQFRYCPS